MKAPRQIFLPLSRGSLGVRGHNGRDDYDMTCGITTVYRPPPPLPRAVPSAFPFNFRALKTAYGEISDWFYEAITDLAIPAEEEDIAVVEAKAGAQLEKVDFFFKLYYTSTYAYNHFFFFF